VAALAGNSPPTIKVANPFDPAIAKLAILPDASPPTFTFAAAPATSPFLITHQDPITPPAPGTTWSAAGLYRVTGDVEDRASAGIYNRWKTFQGVAGKLDVEVGAFGGATTRKKVPVAAVLGGFRYQLHPDVSLVLDTGWQIGNEASGWCFGLSASIKF